MCDEDMVFYCDPVVSTKNAIITRYREKLFLTFFALLPFLHETRNPKIHGNVIYGNGMSHELHRNCGLTDKEMKITFNEYCGLNPTTYELDTED